MTDHPHDLLLDAALDEVLGGRTPPDLSARIMQALAVRGSGISPESVALANGHVSLLPPAAEPIAPPVATANCAAPANPVGSVLATVNRPVPIAPSRNGQVASRAESASRRPNWLALAIALGTVAVGLPLGYFAVRYANAPSGEVAGEVVNVKQPTKPAAGLKTPDQLAKQDGQNQPEVGPRRKPGRDAIADRPGSEFDSQLPFGPKENQPGEPSSSFARAKAQPEPDDEIVAFANSVLRQAWEEKGVKPSPPATDAEWARRTYLRIVGRIPTVEELQRFTGSKSPDKKRELADELLTGEHYREEFARHWAEFFANVLIGRTAGTEDGAPASREGLVQYLRHALTTGKSYDRLAFDLLTATGSGQPGSSDYNGAANFLLASLNETSLNEKGVLATSRTSRVFLGKQLQCAQCHHHPSNDWSQSHFWELNAFFRQMGSERDRETGSYKLVTRDFRGETGDPDHADVFYEVPSGRMKVAYPAFPGTPAVSPSGLVSEVDRRAELARRVVASDDLARSAVNRLWGHFLGFGFTRPVDDMGPHNPPSHPALLERLAQQFAAHEYRLPDVMRWIVMSEAFNLSSKMSTDNLVDAPEAGEPPLFARYYTRQMQPEQVYESLQIAAAAQKNGGGVGELTKARLVWLGQFTREMGTDDGEEQDTFNGDIRQSLIMMHGPLMQRATSGEQGSMLERVAQSKLPFDEKVEHLFLAALARKPVKRELELAAKIHSDRGDTALALQDIWWAVLNSNEFILDH